MKRKDTLLITMKVELILKELMIEMMTTITAKIEVTEAVEVEEEAEAEMLEVEVDTKIHIKNREDIMIKTIMDKNNMKKEIMVVIKEVKEEIGVAIDRETMKLMKITINKNSLMSMMTRITLIRREQVAKNQNLSLKSLLLIMKISLR